MMNLSCLIEGKPMVYFNGPSDNGKVSLNMNNQSACLSSSLLSTQLYEHNETNIGNNHADNNGNSDLILKPSPEKPLSFIISQSRPSVRRTSAVIKRKLAKDELLIVPSAPNKRKKPNDFSQHSTVDQKLTPVSQNYEIPNKFWELMEPYCAEINDDHIKTLDNLIKSYENDIVYYEVPEMPVKHEDASENHALGVSLRRNVVEEDVSHLNGFVDGKNGVDLSNLLKKIDIEIR